MQDIDPTQTNEEGISTRVLKRLLYLALAVLAVLLLVLLPPLINVNRYQHRIASSIGDSLGRPVHLNKVSLNLLPLPGFTLENFVVEEDPSFGSEPVIHADSVRATLRLSSLWSRRVEFSSISFSEPTSVNLVRIASGQWNLESILLHASHIDAAPTAQRRAGSAPRFPYIEATGARINLKLGNEKSPVSLTDADFALWLPDPQQWHLRLEAHPVRTDSDVYTADPGVLNVEGTLGRASSLENVPIDLRASWSKAPLGNATSFLFGHDAGLRGDMTLLANAQGTIGSSKLQTRLEITGLRRADFVPENPLAIDLQCLATATGAFHTFADIRCNWPPTGTSGPPILAITGSLPDVRQPNLAEFSATTPGLPAATLVDWLHAASSRTPRSLTATGTLTGTLSYKAASSQKQSLSENRPGSLTGTLTMAHATLTAPHAGPSPLPLIDKPSPLIDSNITLTSAAPAPPTPHHRHAAPPAPAAGFQLLPVSLDLGGREPATVEGRFDSTGYTLHLTGTATTARVEALATALPSFGDGLAQTLSASRSTTPYHVDLTVTRPWGGAPTWTDNATTPRPQHHHRR